MSNLSNPSKRGLPSNLKMRHDAHYVEELVSSTPAPIGRMIQVEHLEPNPEQPRVDFGDLTELSESIREKGVLEPLLVCKKDSTERWMIIAGERRWRAARAAGLEEVPCIELDVDSGGVAEIALIENLQRKDLTIWEESDGLLFLAHRFGYTHEDIARKVGKSRSSITELLSIATLPEAMREQCRKYNITSKSLLLQIVRQPDEASMQKMMSEVVDGELNRDEARVVRRALNSINPPKSLSKPFKFNYRSPTGDFNLDIKFNQAIISNEQVIASLEEVIGSLSAVK